MTCAVLTCVVDIFVPTPLPPRCISSLFPRLQVFVGCGRKEGIASFLGHTGLALPALPPGAQPTPEVVHHVELPYLREEAAHRLLVLLSVLDGPSPARQRGVGEECWGGVLGRGVGEECTRQAGTEGPRGVPSLISLLHLKGEAGGPQLSRWSGNGVTGVSWGLGGPRGPSRRCSPPGCIPPGSTRGSGCRVPCPLAPGKVVSQGPWQGRWAGSPQPEPPALPLTSCSPTRSWFLARREPGGNRVSPPLGRQRHRWVKTGHCQVSQLAGSRGLTQGPCLTPGWVRTHLRAAPRGGERPEPPSPCRGTHLRAGPLQLHYSRERGGRWGLGGGKAP